MAGISTLDDLLGAISDLHDAPTLPILIERLEEALAGLPLAGLAPLASPADATLQIPRLVAELADRQAGFAEGLDEREARVLRMLVIAFQARLENLLPSANEDMALTARERDVLRWFADGKSAEDVAAIMQISSGTVMFHYRRAADRLGTLNRTHTVVEAMRRGLIPLLSTS